MNKALAKLAFAVAGHPGYYLSRKIRSAQKASGSNSIAVLDLGGGRPWKVARLFLGDSLKDVTITVVDEIVPDTHVLDHLDGVKLSRHQGEAMTFCGKLEDNSQDVVFLLDVLEHLPKHSGWMMLYEINRIARYGIGVTVPNGFDWQPPSPDNPFQAHISSWSYKDFKLGKMSKISGTHGIKALTSQYATKKYGLRALTYPLYFFEVVIGRLFPRISAKIWAENSGESMLPLSDVETATDKIL